MLMSASPPVTLGSSPFHFSIFLFSMIWSFSEALMLRFASASPSALVRMAAASAATAYGAFRVAARELAEEEANNAPQGLWSRLFGKPKGEIR